MAACKYVVRNGTKIPVDLANKIMVLKSKGYTNAKIAKQFNLSEVDVVNITIRG